VGEISALLRVDLREMALKLRSVDQAIAQDDMRIKKLFQDEKEAHARLQAAAARIRQIKSELAQIDQATQAGVGRFSKKALRGIGTALIGQALTEVNIPEAAQPVVRMTAAAAGGFQTMGLAGAGAFATVAYVTEVYRAVKAVYERLEKVREKLLELGEKQEREDLRLEREIEEERRERAERIFDARLDAIREARKRFLEDRRAAALDAA
jgi:hypothetical protein